MIIEISVKLGHLTGDLRADLNGRHRAQSSRRRDLRSDIAAFDGREAVDRRLLGECDSIHEDGDRREQYEGCDCDD